MIALYKLHRILQCGLHRDILFLGILLGCVDLGFLLDFIADIDDFVSDLIRNGHFSGYRIDVIIRILVSLNRKLCYHIRSRRCLGQVDDPVLIVICILFGAAIRSQHGSAEGNPRYQPSSIYKLDLQIRLDRHHYAGDIDASIFVVCLRRRS